MIRLEFFKTRYDYESEPRDTDAIMDCQTMAEALRVAELYIKNNPGSVVAIGE